MHEAHAEVLARLIREVCPAICTGVEVGVYRADTSSYLLRELPGLELLWLVDRWDSAPFRLDRNKFSLMARFGDRWHSRNEAAARQAVAFADERVQIVKADFRVAARLIRNESLDFCFLDAAHSRQDTWDQIELYNRRVRPGGLVAGHDYDAPRDGYEVVAAAVDEYTGRCGAELRIEPESFVWWFIK